MKLRYDNSLTRSEAPLVMENNHDFRVELHLRGDVENSVTLLALSGAASGQPTKERQQGPYNSFDQAVAARNAIAGELRKSGLEPCDRPAIWSIHAQRRLREIREAKGRSRVDTTFKPSDVLPPRL